MSDKLGEVMSRRRFLKTVAGGAASTVLLAGCEVLQVKQVQPTVQPNSSPLVTETPTVARLTETPTLSPPTATETPSPTSTFIRLPDAPSPEVSLKQTAVVLETSGLEHSFREEAGFTKEMFEKARRGTVLIQVIGDKLGPNGVPREGWGTGYITQHTDNSIQIFTAKHEFVGKKISENIGNVTGLRMFRPYLDKKQYIPSAFSVVMTSGPDLDPDIAIVSCAGEYKSDVPLESVKYKTKQDLKGKDVLVVGFPGVWYEGKDALKSPTMGSVMKILGKNLIPDSSNLWVAQGISSSGVSGSPVFAIENNELNFVGLATNDVYGDNKIEPGQIQKQWFTGIQSLEVDNLLNTLNSVNELPFPKSKSSE